MSAVTSPPGTYYLHENSILLTKERSKENIYALWKEAHKKRPDCYHQVSYEPDVPVKGMPRRWDCSQLKPGDDLMGEPCCDNPILVWDMRGMWSCSECGQLWFEQRTIRSDVKVNRATKLINENEDRKDKISNDPMARSGGVVSEFREDYDNILRTKLGRLLEDPTCTVEEGETAMEYLGCMAQDAFERRVYG